MAPLAFLFVAAGLAGSACKVLTYREEKSNASKDAAVGLERFLRNLTSEVSFVSRNSGVYRFWPKWHYKGVAYDGGICADLYVDLEKNKVMLKTFFFIKNNWGSSSSGWEGFDAAEILAQLKSNAGVATGIPLPLQREMASSSICRRVVCGISISEQAAISPNLSAN